MIQKIPLLSLWLRERRISCKYLINQTSLCLTATDKLSQKSCSFHPFVLRDTKNSTGEMQRVQRGCFDHVFLQTVGCGLPSKNVHRVGLRTVVPVSSAVIKFLCISFHWNLKSYLHLEKKNRAQCSRFESLTFLQKESLYLRMSNETLNIKFWISSNRPPVTEPETALMWQVPKHLSLSKLQLYLESIYLITLEEINFQS